MRRMKRIVISALALVISAEAAVAQTGTPAAGTWGFEGSPGTASLLRFRSPSAAWVLGFDGFYARQSSDNAAISDEDVASLNLRAGIRSYGKGHGNVRPFATISAMAGYTGDGGTHIWSVGPAAEFGAAYFFSPHVSLGGSGQLTAMYSTRGADVSTFMVGVSGFRLLGAVYF